MYGNMANQHEAFLRRKLEEEQAAELQQAIELEGRRFMGLQLLDLKSRGHHHLGSGAPMPLRQATDGKGSGSNGNDNASHLEDAWNIFPLYSAVIFTYCAFNGNGNGCFQGGSPYIYPLYGLGELPQVCQNRIC
jgi:hypothetical protein